MRKLMHAALAYTLTLLLVHYFQLRNALIYVIPTCIFVSEVAFCFLQGQKRIAAIIVSCFVLLGFVRYEIQARNTIDVFESFIGNEIRVTAELCEYPIVYEDSVKYTVKLKTDLLPKTKAIIYDYTTTETGLHPGDRIRTTIRLSSAQLSLGEETDSYISKGIYARGYVTDEIKTISQANKLKYAPIYLAESIRHVITQSLTPRSAAFLSALITGSKVELYENTELYYALRDSGISHVIAVSGMHVSFVVAFAMLLFGHRIGWAFSVAFIVLFAIMTGLSPSVLRAVFMQCLFLLAPVLRRESDAITSIAFALLIILLWNPFAVASVGLQLSFLSMTGIILITPKSFNWFKEKCPFKKPVALAAYRFVSASLSSSLGATLFTAPLCAYYYGSISVLSPITNLFVVWLLPVCFIGGFVLCGIDILIPFATPFAATILEIPISVILSIAEQIGSVPFATVYLPNSLMILWFSCVYLLIAAMFFFRKNGYYRPLIPILTAVLSLAILCDWNHRRYAEGLTLGALDVGQGQCIVVLDGNITLVSDCGGNYDAGDTTAQWLYSHGRTQVDALVISHFDEDHTNGVVDLMSQIPVNEILYSGNNITKEELPQFLKIKEMAKIHGTSLHLVNSTSDFAFDSMRLRLYAPKGNSSNDGLILSLRSGDYHLMVMGDADIEAENQLLYDPIISDVDCLVVGHHGSKYSSGEAFLRKTNPKIAIISSGYNTYGHPSDEVLDRLLKENVVLYRTDQLDSIEIKVR